MKTMFKKFTQWKKEINQSLKSVKNLIILELLALALFSFASAIVMFLNADYRLHLLNNYKEPEIFLQQQPLNISFNPTSGSLSANKIVKLIIRSGSKDYRISGFDLTLKSAGNLKIKGVSNPRAIDGSPEFIELIKDSPASEVRLAYVSAKTEDQLPTRIEIDVTVEPLAAGPGSLQLKTENGSYEFVGPNPGSIPSDYVYPVNVTPGNYQMITCVPISLVNIIVQPRYDLGSKVHFVAKANDDATMPIKWVLQGDGQQDINVSATGRQVEGEYTWNAIGRYWVGAKYSNSCTAEKSKNAYLKVTAPCNAENIDFRVCFQDIRAYYLKCTSTQSGYGWQQIYCPSGWTCLSGKCTLGSVSPKPSASPAASSLACPSPNPSNFPCPPAKIRCTNNCVCKCMP